MKQLREALIVLSAAVIIAATVQGVSGTYFYGSHADHLSQWAQVIRLKAIVKAKAFDCKLQHFCLKGTIKRLLFKSSQAIDDIMQALSDHHPGITGAIAAGWVGKDCQAAFPRCNQKIVVVSSAVPCRPGETCYREEDTNATTTPTSSIYLEEVGGTMTADSASAEEATEGGVMTFPTSADDQESDSQRR